MPKVWVLDTETKGTGATVVPLETTQAKPARRDARVFVPREGRPAAEPAPAPPAPRRFRVMDVLTRQTLSDDAGLRPTLDVLQGVRSVVDVRVSVWDPEREAWRLLTLPEQRALWDARER